MIKEITNDNKGKFFKDNSPSEIILKLSVLVIIIFRLMPIIVKVLNSFQKLNTIYPPASIALNEFFSDITLNPTV